MKSSFDGVKLNTILKDEINKGNKSFILGEGSTQFKEGAFIGLSALDDGSVKLRVSPQSVGQLHYIIGLDGKISGEDTNLVVDRDESYKGRNKPAKVDIIKSGQPRYALEDILWATGIDLSKAMIEDS